MFLRLRAGSWLAACLLLAALHALSGCAVFHAEGPPVGANPESVRLREVPFYSQRAHQCGPAALAMMMSWAGLPVTPEEMTPFVYSPGLEGTLQPALIGAARRHGLLAYPLAGKEAAFAELAAGHPVLVLQNLAFSWFPRWHYAVLIGYDHTSHQVFLHTGRERFAALSWRVFNNTWKRSGYWGVVILPPEQLPATAQEAPYLQAVIGLEQAGRPQAAIRAYRRAAGKWPESLGAWMGLGNAAYASGDLPAAEEAFRRAVSVQPSAGAAWNNLAQVLWEEGRRAEAMAAIRKAVALGGPLQSRFVETMRLIESGEEDITSSERLPDQQGPAADSGDPAP